MDTGHLTRVISELQKGHEKQADAASNLAARLEGLLQKGCAGGEASPRLEKTCSEVDWCAAFNLCSAQQLHLNRLLCTRAPELRACPVCSMPMPLHDSICEWPCLFSNGLSERMAT